MVQGTVVPNGHCGEMKPLHHSSPGKSSFRKLTSEAHYDADAETSEDSDTQKEKINDVVNKRRRYSETCGTETDQDSQYGSDLVRCNTTELEQATVQDKIHILKVRRPSPDETVGNSTSISSASEAVMQSGGPGEKGFVVDQTSYASNLSEKEDYPGPLPAIGLCPKLRSVAPRGEGFEDMEPESLTEPTKVCDELVLAVWCPGCMVTLKLTSAA